MTGITFRRQLRARSTARDGWTSVPRIRVNLLTPKLNATPAGVSRRLELGNPTLKLKQDADAAERVGRFDKAIGALKEIVRNNPRDWNAVSRIGDLYSRLNDTKAANEHHVKVARFLVDEGFYLKAIALWKKILRSDPSMLDGHMSLGDLYARQGLPAEAKQTFDFVYQEYVKSNKLSEAGEVLRRMADVDPSDMKVRIRLAELYVREGASEKAAGEFGGIADELVKKGLLVETLQFLGKALRSVPRHPRLLIAAARVHLIQKDYPTAVSLLEEAHRAAPNDAEVARFDEILTREADLEKAADEVLRRMAEVDLPDTSTERSVTPQQSGITGRVGMPVKLGELLLKESMVSPQQLQQALNHQRVNGGKLSRAFVALGLVRDEEITSLLSRRYGVPSVDLDHLEVDPATIKIIPAETARRYQVLPVSVSDRTLTVAMADPTNVFAMDDIRFMTAYRVQPVVASEGALEVAIDRYYPHEPGDVNVKKVDEATLSVDDLAALGGLSDVDLDAVADAATDADAANDEVVTVADATPIVKLVNNILVDSLKRGASHIHIEPYEKKFRVRFRIDGVLYNVLALPLKLREPLVARLKFMAKLDVAEKRLPQHGRFKVKFKLEDRSRDLDFVVTCVPTPWGETLVLRLLDKAALVLDLAELGLEPNSAQRFRKALCRPFGIILVTGPTGSGKTNTLCAALAALNRPDVNIVTVEDPIEFHLPGINQIQLREQVGLDSAAALRAFRRLDANILLVSEVRGKEEADLMAKLALNGRLVLSSLDANDAPSAVSLLASMGVDMWPMAVALNLIQAQRLVRRICDKCKVDVTAETSPEALLAVGFPSDLVGTFPIFRGRGCASCNGTGYKGRVGLYEGMEITENIRDLIKAGAPTNEIRKKALEEGMISLRASGLEKIKQGITTIEEVFRQTVA